MEDVNLKKAQELYNLGEWPKAKHLLDEYLTGIPGSLTAEEIAEARCLRGWSRYYLGIKDLEEKIPSLNKAKEDFLEALDQTQDPKISLSALNGLPLTLWILGEQEEAWKTNARALQEFPAESSAWNTCSILCRWKKDFLQSLEVCEKVYWTALEQKDYRMAGHGKQNRGDALKELGRINEARDEYAAAFALYREYERTTRKSAAPHLASVEKKILAL